MIKIEKDIPIPKLKSDKYPIKELEVGDSFFVSCEEKQREKVRGRIWNAIRVQMTRHELIRNHSVRSVDGGLRVWRTS